MEQNQNPFFVLHQELLEQRQLIEKLIFNQTPLNVQHDANKYECGVEVACQVTGLKRQTIYQRIKDIPHKRLHGKLYFCRAELQAYIKREGK